MSRQGEMAGAPADDDDRDPGEPALRALIAAEIAAAGPISFARFMALALLHPKYGYYAARPAIGRRIADIGSGDPVVIRDSSWVGGAASRCRAGCAGCGARWR